MPLIPTSLQTMHRVGRIASNVLCTSRLGIAGSLRPHKLLKLAPQGRLPKQTYDRQLYQSRLAHTRSGLSRQAWTTLPTMTSPYWLYLPLRQHPAPAMMCLHPPSPILPMPGLRTSKFQNGGCTHLFLRRIPSHLYPCHRHHNPDVSSTHPALCLCPLFLLTHQQNLQQ